MLPSFCLCYTGYQFIFFPHIKAIRISLGTLYYFKSHGNLVNTVDGTMTPKLLNGHFFLAITEDDQIIHLKLQLLLRQNPAETINILRVTCHVNKAHFYDLDPWRTITLTHGAQKTIRIFLQLTYFSRPLSSIIVTESPMSISYEGETSRQFIPLVV